MRKRKRESKRAREREKALYILFSGSRAQFIIREDKFTVLIKKLPYSARSSILIEDWSTGFSPPERERDSTGTEEEREAHDGKKSLRFQRNQTSQYPSVREQTSGREEECRQRWDYAAERSNSAMFG